jgi:hypothetical protein
LPTLLPSAILINIEYLTVSSANTNEPLAIRALIRSDPLALTPPVIDFRDIDHARQR